MEMPASQIAHPGDWLALAVVCTLLLWGLLKIAATQIQDLRSSRLEHTGCRRILVPLKESVIY